jgi:hypothetical protein
MELEYAFIRNNSINRKFKDSIIESKFLCSVISEENMLKINELHTSILDEDSIPSEIIITSVQAQVGINISGSKERMVILTKDSKYNLYYDGEDIQEPTMSINTKEKYDIVIEMIKNLVKPESNE